MRLKCGKNVKSASFSGSADDQNPNVALREAFKAITKQFKKAEDDLVNLGLCPDRCIKKVPNDPTGSWQATKFQFLRLKNGQWRVTWRFEGTVTVTCK